MSEKRSDDGGAGKDMTGADDNPAPIVSITSGNINLSSITVGNIGGGM